MLEVQFEVVMGALGRDMFSHSKEGVGQATPDCLRLCGLAVWRFGGDDRTPLPNVLVDVQAGQHPLTSIPYLHSNGMNGSKESKVVRTT